MQTAAVTNDGPRWHPMPSAEALEDEAATRIAHAAREALARQERFRVVLAGGNTPRNVYRKLVSIATDWSRWEVYFGDERCLALNDAARNDRMAHETLLDHVPIAAGAIHRIPAEQGAAAAAQAYERTLAGVGPFDLVLLGLGEDGHTASLFPGHDIGAAADSPDVLAVFDAPKPPRERVSMSAARLSRAPRVLFLVAGGEKRDVVHRWKAGEAMPAAGIRATSGVDVLVERGLLNAGSKQPDRSQA